MRLNQGAGVLAFVSSFWTSVRKSARGRTASKSGSCRSPSTSQSAWAASRRAATALLIAHQSLGPLLDRLNFLLQTGDPADPAIDRVVGYLGAGLYVETLFRLLFLSLTGAMFQLAGVGRALGTGLGILLSSLVFAAVHHLGRRARRTRGLSSCSARWPGCTSRCCTRRAASASRWARTPATTSSSAWS